MFSKDISTNKSIQDWARDPQWWAFHWSFKVHNLGVVKKIKIAQESILSWFIVLGGYMCLHVSMAACRIGPEAHSSQSKAHHWSFIYYRVWLNWIKSTLLRRLSSVDLLCWGDACACMWAHLLFGRFPLAGARIFGPISAKNTSKYKFKIKNAWVYLFKI